MDDYNNESIKGNESKIIYKDKDKIMEMIRTQNFIEGFWEINDNTEMIKEKYIKEYDLLMKLENKNMDEKVAMTILIIYFINKEYPGLINELIMIIRKANKFIKKITNDDYENILKIIGIY